VAVVAGLIGALLASSVGMATGAFGHRTTVLSPVKVITPSTVALADASSSPADWPSIANTLAPSVVAISVNGQRGPVNGSGVVYVDSSNRTFVLTDEDLFDGSGSIRVRFNDGGVDTGHLLRVDATTGLAVLWVAGSGRAVPYFGSVSNVRIADTVLALGAGPAQGGAVAPSTVSGLDWPVNLQDGSSRIGMMALTAASMPPQTAGGPLVDRQGTIVGITSPSISTDPDQHGFAYAIPIDVAEHVASDILSGRSPTHPWLGLNNMVDLTPGAARALGLPGGVQVATIARGGPAAAAGVATGDIVTTLDGHPVTSTGALTAVLSHCEPGKTVTLTYLHKGKPVTVTFSVAEQRDAPPSSP